MLVVADKSTFRSRTGITVHGHRVLLAGADVFQVLRTHRRTIRQAQPTLDRALRRRIRQVLRDHSSVRDEPIAKHCTLLRAHVGLGRDRMARPVDRPSQRGRDDVQQSYLHQDLVSGSSRSSGHAETGGAVEGRNDPSKPRGLVPQGSSEPTQHPILHQLFHEHRYGRADRGYAGASEEFAKGDDVDLASCDRCWYRQSGGQGKRSLVR